MQEIAVECQELAIDVLAISETNVKLTPTTTKKLHDGIRRQNKNYKMNMTHNHLKAKKDFKPGGTGLITFGSTSGRIVEQRKDNMGRWTETVFRGKFGKVVTVISAYQSPVSEFNDKFTYHNQQCILLEQQGRLGKTKQEQQTGPRKYFAKDLIEQIQMLKQKGEELIVGGDFNDFMGSEGSIGDKLQTQCQLVDVWTATNPEEDEPETYQREKNRIDLAFATIGVLKTVRSAEYSEYGTIAKSDHRALIIEIDSAELWGKTDPILQQQERILHSNDIRQLVPYIEKMFDHCLQHNIFDRLEKLQDEFNGEELEKIDKIISQAGDAAEKSLQRKRKPWWSLPLVRARVKQVALKKQQLALRKSKSRKDELDEYLEKKQADWSVPEDYEECTRQLQEATEALRDIIRSAKEKRRSYQEDLAGSSGRKQKMQIKVMIRKEQTAEAFRILRIVRSQTRNEIKSIQVPKEWPDSDKITDKEQLIDPRKATEWKTVTDNVAILRYVLARNELHFHQAAGTPTTIGFLKDMFDWAVTSEGAKDILEGNYDGLDFEVTERTVLKHLQKKTAETLPAEITIEDVRGKLKVWKESMSTLPSGRHLGRYKALVASLDHVEEKKREECKNKQQQLLASITAILQLCLDNRYIMHQWKKIVTTMIPKSAKDRRVHRLRVINIYEADYNMCLGILWRKLLSKMDQEGTLHSDQHGSRRGHSAQALPFVEEIIYDQSRYTRTSLVNFDNDAMSCYDRIIPAFAGMTAKSYGQSDAAVFVNNITLQTAKYYLKMGGTTTAHSYQNSDSFELYGTGQGSANSPTIWAMVNSTLFTAQEELAFGAEMESPDGKLKTKTSIFGYVDDSAGRVSDFKDSLEVPVNRLVEKMEHDAQVWSDILWFSGGRPELDKCSYHVMSHVYDKEGRAKVNVIPKHERITITDPQTNKPVEIEYKTPYMPHKILGHQKSPVGDRSPQREEQRKKGIQTANAIASCAINAGQAQQLYWSVLVPTVGYTLPQLYELERTLREDQQRVTRILLPKMGVNRNTSKTIIYGSKNLGGLGLLDWFHLQGEGQIKNFVSHWRSTSKISKILKITSAWAQQFAGISDYFLATHRKMSYLPNGWLKNLADYLQQTNTKIRVDEPNIYPPQRENDVHIMDRVIDSGLYKDKEQEMINNCRLHLRVTTISDMTNIDGTHMSPAARTGNFVFLDSEAKGNHIRTRRPGKESWKLWNQVLRSFADGSGKLYQPLGQWRSDGASLKRIWNDYYDVTEKVIYRREGNCWRKFIKIGSKFYKDTIGPCTPASTSVPCRLKRVNREAVQICGNICKNANKYTDGLILEVLEQQPASIRELLRNHEWHVEPFEAYQCIIEDGGVIQAASDGSATDLCLTFGWVIATKTGKKLVSGNGQGYGQTSSHRAESYGMVAVTAMLSMWEQYVGAKDIKVQLWCDNKGLVQRVNQRRGYDYSYTTTTLAPDWDTVEQVYHHINNMQMEVHLQHVKGHQDREDTTTTTEKKKKLSVEAQLNITADELAGDLSATIGSVSLETTEAIIPLLPCTGALVDLSTGTITGHYSTMLRLYNSEEQLKKYIEEKNQWDDQTSKNVDWVLLRKHLRKHSYQNIWSMKYIHDLLPTAKIRNRYNNKESAACSACSCKQETWQHVLACKGGDHRKITKKIRSDIFRIIDDNIPTQHRSLIKMGISHSIELPYGDISELSPSQKRIYDKQTQIGWIQFLKGFWTKHWGTIPILCIDDSGITTDWRIKFLESIWQAMSDGWKAYTSKLHASTEDQPMITQKRLYQRIEEIQGQYLTSHGRQHPSFVQDMKKKSTYYLESWLELHGQNLILQTTSDSVTRLGTNGQPPQV